MEMEVVVPVPATAMDTFNFDHSSTCSSPYMTAPSSPQRFGNFYFSAPTSPSRASSSFFRGGEDLHKSSTSMIPFDWEEKPGTPKNRDFNFINSKQHTNVGDDDGDEDEDFEFNFSGQLDQRSSISAADELFDGGKIKPLKPPPGYNIDSSLSVASSVSSPRSPRTPRKKKGFDPFAAAIEETRKRTEITQLKQDQHQRGRERSISGSSSSTSNYVRKGTRSLSPMRVSDIIFEDEDNPPTAKMVASNTRNPKSYAASILSAISFNKGYKKWKLKDFKDLLLFRSASEGHSTSKDQLNKYAVLSKKEPEDVKNASFRSTESVGSSFGGGSRRRGPPVSAHEMHYTANRAISEEMRRKTFLPYRQGLLGCLGFNPGSVPDISSRIGSLPRG